MQELTETDSTIIQLRDYANSVRNLISSTSYQNRKRGKPISVSKILNSIEVPFDQIDAADKASRNPNHEHYGKDINAIIDIWNTKTNVSSDYGKGVDDYAQSVLAGGPMNIDDILDETMKAKCRGFKKLYDEFIRPNQILHIGSEMSFASSLGYSGRMDELSMIMTNDGPALVVLDWKQNEKISMTGFMGATCVPPFHNMAASKINRFTTQLYLYKQYLESELGFNVVGTLIGHVKRDDYEILRPSYKYNVGLIRRIIEFAKLKN